MINTQGYVVKVEGQTMYLKTAAMAFDGIKKLLKNPKIDGFVSIVLGRDNFDIYCGPVEKARSKFRL